MIRWPDRFDPARAPVHVSNEISIDAPAARVWAWLVRASLWPNWYPNSSRVRIAGGASDLSAGADFSWRTFGVAIRSVVAEFQPHERIAWTALGLGVDAYHAWLIAPTPTGVRVLTEETQYGWAARLNARVLPGRMHRFHQVWLEQLRAVSLGGPPPGGAAQSLSTKT